MAKKTKDNGGDRTPLGPISKKAARAEAAQTVSFHPVANMFPLMQGEAFDALVKDIAERGLEQDIVLHEGGILDGRNRYRACLKAGVEPRFTKYSGSDPVAYVISANLHRRHLTREQKRDVIVKLLKAKPELSDRAIGKMAKTDHKTVAKVRTEKESTGEIPQLAKTVGTDGRSRTTKLKAKKPRGRIQTKDLPGPNPARAADTWRADPASPGAAPDTSPKTESGIEQSAPTLHQRLAEFFKLAQKIHNSGDELKTVIAGIPADQWDAFVKAEAIAYRLFVALHKETHYRITTEEERKKFGAVDTLMGGARHA
jgi:ParB-like chromosome segregation protein Spo0J